MGPTMRKNPRTPEQLAEELLGGLTALEQVAAAYPVRGIKGATGTQLDQINLFGGDTAKVAALERQIAQHLGLPAAFRAPWTGTGPVRRRGDPIRPIFGPCAVYLSGRRPGLC